MTAIRFTALFAVFALLAPLGIATEVDATVRVGQVMDDDIVVLERPVDGADLCALVGIQAPNLPLGWPGFPPWPLTCPREADSGQAPDTSPWRPAP
jgi:hypothetical protein